MYTVYIILLQYMDIDFLISFFQQFTQSLGGFKPAENGTCSIPIL